MSANTQVPFVRTQAGITLCLKGRSYSFAKEDTQYPDIVAAINNGESQDEILSVINAAATSFKNATKLTKNVMINDGVVYFNDEPLHMSLADRMVQMLAEGYDLVPMAKFLENLMAKSQPYGGSRTLFFP